MTLEHANWCYRCGQTQGKADQWADDFRQEVLRHEAEVERIERVGREMMLNLDKSKTSVIGATVAATPGLSDNKLVYLIRQTPRLNKLFNKLTIEGKRRVLTLAAGTDFMLAQTIEDVLEQERGN